MPTLAAKATTLIRAPRSDVFDAFVEPATITRFWLESTSGPLAADATVSWRFMVPGATEQVYVTTFRPAEHIAFDWSSGLHVTLDFVDWRERVTKVSVAVTGFAAASDTDRIVNTTEGFSIVLCDLKTLLESGRSANLVRDKAELVAATASSS